MSATGRSGRFVFLVCAIASLVLCVSCRTSKPLPPIDLSEETWRVFKGQAVWKPTRTRPELTGELLLATNRNGDFFVQFTKEPFPIATAQRVGERWQIKFGANERSSSGRGTPPNRFVWFQLPRAFAESRETGDWTFESSASNFWRFENARTGEMLEGEFFP